MIVLQSLIGETSLVHHQKLVLHVGLYMLLTNVGTIRDKLKIIYLFYNFERERGNILTLWIEGIPREVK